MNNRKTFGLHDDFVDFKQSIVGYLDHTQPDNSDLLDYFVERINEFESEIYYQLNDRIDTFTGAQL